jgi:hypothetical protein
MDHVILTPDQVENLNANFPLTRKLSDRPSLGIWETESRGPFEEWKIVVRQRPSSKSEQDPHAEHNGPNEVRTVHWRSLCASSSILADRRMQLQHVFDGDIEEWGLRVGGVVRYLAKVPGN